MKASIVMSVDIVAAKDSLAAIEIATSLVLGAFNGVPIIDDNGIVIGIATTIDIVRAIRDGKNLENMLARDLMTKALPVVKQDTKIENIIDIMDKKGIETVPVVEEESNSRFVGVVSRSDILAEKIMKGLLQQVGKGHLQQL
jgi:CBS domain-containing protein